MRQSDRLRAVYKELRAAVGPSVPSVELIKIAHLILRAYGGNDRELYAVQESRPSQTDLALPVDRVMNDGGWRLLAEQSLQCEVEEGLGLISLKQELLEKFVGPAWYHQAHRD
jgi:hypothetical protein